MFWIRPKTEYLIHNFDYRYASKSTQGSIDAYFDLVFKKTLSQKNGSMGWGPGPAKCGENFQNMSSLWCHLRKAPHRKRKTLFFDFDYKTCWIRRGFEPLSSSIAWRVIGLQISAKKRSCAGLKGLKILTAMRRIDRLNCQSSR